jgi:signal transduction histidine kinase
LKISVKDTGVGMKKEIVENLFKDYNTFDNDEGLNK